MSHTYQCGHRHCRKRYHLNKPVEHYSRPPKGTVLASLTVAGSYMCGRCRRGALKPTHRFVTSWNARQATCHCGLIPYPHREGSSDPNYGACEMHPDFDPFG